MLPIYIQGRRQKKRSDINGLWANKLCIFFLLSKVLTKRERAWSVGADYLLGRHKAQTYTRSMKSLLPISLILLCALPSFGNEKCARKAYLSYWESAPVKKELCSARSAGLRDRLIEAEKAYDLCAAFLKNEKSLSLKGAKESSKVLLYKHLDKEHVDKHCADNVWQFLGELGPEDMDPNEKDFCLKHSDIKRNLIKDCKHSI